VKLLLINNPGDFPKVNQDIINIYVLLMRKILPLVPVDDSHKMLDYIHKNPLIKSFMPDVLMNELQMKLL